jgi:Ca2+-binding EF-hand superfamily protein
MRADRSDVNTANQAPKTRWSSLALLTVALLGALVGTLFTRVPAAQAGRPERVGAAEAGIHRLDTDGDGRLSRAEHAAAARKMFEGMDGDHDGKVTADEMQATLAHTKGRRPSRSMKAANLTAADKIKLSDANHDGVLTIEEHLAAATTNFDRMDGDKDGLLSSTELAAGHAKIQRKGRHR